MAAGGGGGGGGGLDEAAKALLPFLQRADELQKHDPLVSYYCRLYAMEQGLQIPAAQRSKDTSELLVSLMGQLEKDKATVKRSAEDNLHVEGFASRVFDKADRQDRAGKADLATAKTFYAAGLFFEVLSQFGPLPAELQAKQKYAVWKAGDIRKALKEGRAPTPGPPGGDDQTRQTWAQSASTSSLTAPSGTGALDSLGNPAAAPTAPSPSTDEFGLPTAPLLTPSLSARVAPTSGPGHWGPPPSGSGVPPASYDQGPGSYPAAPQPYSHYGNSTQPAQAPYSQHPPSAPPVPPVGSSVPFPQTQTSSYSYPYPSHQSPSSSLPFAKPVAAPHPSAVPAPSFASATPAAGPDTSHLSAVTAGASSLSLNSAPPASQSPAMLTSFSAGSSQPTPGKVADAHKAARFAVSSLAFDDVPTAIEYLKKALDLLTKP